MEDSRIIDLFFERRDEAVAETEAKYHAYCYSIALRMLKNNEDAEECVNDVMLALWKSIPPNRPEKLSSYLAALTRNESINRLRKANSKKHDGGKELLPLEELAELETENDDPQAAAEEAELTALVQAFVEGLPPVQQSIFIDRYWFWDSVTDISIRLGYSEARIYTILHRLRKKLSQILKEKGYHV